MTLHAHDSTATPNAYRIEKTRLPVTVTLIGGAKIEGDLFVRASSRYAQRLEDAPEVLNAPQPFFPMALPSGEIALVAKAHVYSLRGGPGAIHQDFSLGTPRTVELFLCDGERITGRVLIEPRRAHTRVLDFLNVEDEKFFTVFLKHGLLLVNRSQVIRVRPLD
ncbi:MAG TPA: hypothetical protein VH762_11845 [Gemmatimonadaceae bacterium]|jgi:hypothetical protein